MYVLITTQDTYFVEYLIGTLVLSSSITCAMDFADLETAHKFRKMLLLVCQLQTTVTTFIN